MAAGLVAEQGPRWERGQGRCGRQGQTGARVGDGAITAAVCLASRD